MTEAKKKINRVQTTARVSEIMNSFYNSMFEGSSKVCWCVGACPYEMFSAAGMKRFQTENHAARISTAQQQAMYIDAAEAEGLSVDCCSYAKINIGQALMMARGKEDLIPERFRLPKPDIIFALNTCHTMIQWSDCLADIFKVPEFVVDAPFIYDEANWDRNIAYVKSQLQDLISFLEDITGKPYNYQALHDTLVNLREMTSYRRQILELCKTKPASAGFLDTLISLGPANTVRDDASVVFYRDLRDEISQRVKNNVRLLEKEKYRIMWRGNFPWHKVGTVSRMLANYDAILVSGGYGQRAYGDVAGKYIPPDGFNLDDPLWTIAAEHCARSYTRTLEWKIEEEFAAYIEGFSIDAVIIHSPRTCRPWALGAFELAKAAEERFGIPVLILEADHTDPNYFQDAQVENRIQALLERVDMLREKD